MVAVSLESPKDRMQERVALITGAAGGLGSTVARLLGHTHVLVLTDGNRKRDSVTASIFGISNNLGCMQKSFRGNASNI